MNEQRGYTLIETLITLTLVLILSAGGLYGWQAGSNSSAYGKPPAVRDYGAATRRRELA